MSNRIHNKGSILRRPRGLSVPRHLFAIVYLLLQSSTLRPSPGHRYVLDSGMIQCESSALTATWLKQLG